MLLPVAVVLGGCSGGDPKPGSADRTFLSRMIPHHERAIEVARVGIDRATDPRVRAFARRIVREQAPELSRMQAQARATTVDTVAGARTAMHRVSDTDLAALRAVSGASFDRRFLMLNISSEQGAAAMARVELSHGRAPDSRTVAKAIAGAPTSEIPELQALLSAIS